MPLGELLAVRSVDYRFFWSLHSVPDHDRSASGYGISFLPHHGLPGKHHAHNNTVWFPPQKTEHSPPGNLQSPYPGHLSHSLLHQISENGSVPVLLSDLAQTEEYTVPVISQLLSDYPVCQGTPSLWTTASLLFRQDQRLWKMSVSYHLPTSPYRKPHNDRHSDSFQ